MVASLSSLGLRRLCSVVMEKSSAHHKAQAKAQMLKPSKLKTSSLKKKLHI